MNSRISSFALGVGAYLAFVFASFPASLAYRWFAPAELALAAVDGTIWRGSAEFGGYEGVRFSDLRWQLEPIALLTGRLSLDAEARLDDGFIRSGVTVSRSRIRLENLVAAVRLETFSALLAFGDIRGNLTLDLPELELVDGWPVSATGEARLADLASPQVFPPSANPPIIPIGNFSARLSVSDGAGIVALVSDEGGPLELEGRASAQADRSWSLDARIKPRANATEALRGSLAFIGGSAGANGEHQVTLQGNF